MSHKSHGELESSEMSQQPPEVFDLLGEMVKRTMGTKDWDSRKLVDTVEWRGNDEEALIGGEQRLEKQSTVLR